MSDRLFRSLVRTGPLLVTGPDGIERRYGTSSPGVVPVAIRLADRAAERSIGRNPALGFGEMFMAGRLTIEAGDIRSLLDLVGYNIRWEKENPVRAALWRPMRVAGAWDAWNWRRRARRNAAHHYDLDDRLYALFLDPERQYSCAYFTGDGQDLDSAQAAKMAHVAAKLCLEPGQRVLDIGCGWGGLACHLARAADVEVLGITLSEPQLLYARARAAAEGLDGRVRFELLDWRDIRGRFDRIVSVGMFEHVGPPHYRAFLARCRELMSEDGLMLLHTVGRADGPGPTDKWLAKYIFPGGYVPALSQIAPAIERSWLWLTDLEVLRGHYERTLDAWYERVQAAREEIVALYDELFFRMWSFYLAGGIAAFRHGGHLVFQLQLARRQEGAPATRDYLSR
ncbi:MAG: cyclopropane-fatty-acyl-phospholipid synthase [Sphingomonadales bacterium]|nr:cyclopropane-fatty-acyl-phospholipid synthase [Sphingomonadales bacterium]